MRSDNLPQAQSQALGVLAKAFDFEAKDLLAPVMQARSLLRDSALAQRIGQAFEGLNWSNFKTVLRIAGGILFEYCGIQCIAHAGAWGVALAGTATGIMPMLIGAGFVVLGAWLMWKGLNLLLPVLAERLESEVASAWDQLWA